MKQKYFSKGIKDGTPIALGYFAVSFSLGIAMKKADMTAFQGFLISLVNLASAGEYADLQVILSNGTYLEMAIATLVANARYVLMSTALSQRISSSTSLLHRMTIGYGITDEIFGIAISEEGDIHPAYIYGALCIAVPAWAVGTALGIVTGNILPALLVNALSVALYGMFLAIIVPPCKKDTYVLLAILISFTASALCTYFTKIPSGTRTILLTVVIAGIFAFLFPHKEKENTHA